jgi:hypothetical protein
MFRFTQSEATAARRNISFYAASATDGFTAVTSGITSPTITIYKNGTGTAVTPVSPTVTHLTGGLWSYQLAATDIDTVGMVSVTIAHASIRTVHLIGHVYSGDAFNSPTTAQTGYLDAAISTRMATYSQPAGFLSATFPGGTIANTTNITGGTITTVSGNVAGSVASVTGNVAGSVASVTGNVAGSVNSVTSAVTVGTINNNVITAASINTGAITDAKIAADAFTAAKFADSALVIGNLAGTGVKAFLGAGSITAGVIGTGAIDADAIAADAITNAKIADSAITIRLSTDGTASKARIIAGSIATDVWSALVTAHTVAESFGARIIRTLLGTTVNQVSINAQHHIAANVHQMQANVIDAAAVDPSTDEAIADAILNRNIAGGGNGTGATTDRTVRSALRALRNKSEIVGSTLTVYTEGDTVAAWTAAVSTTAGANPVTGIDPAGP